MVTTRPLNTSTSVTLNGSGAGTASLGPRIGQRWRQVVASVSIPQPVTNEPLCSLYMGGAAIPANFVDGTYTGSLDSSDAGSMFVLTPGQSVFAVWSGGDPGAIATLSLTGVEEIGG